MFVEILLLTEVQVHVPFVGDGSYGLPSPFKRQLTQHQLLRPSLLVFLLSVKRKRAAYAAGRGLVVSPRHTSNKTAV
jgi:hypothetical protein